MAAKSIVDSVQFCWFWFWFQQLQIRVQLDEQSFELLPDLGKKGLLVAVLDVLQVGQWYILEIRLRKENTHTDVIA